VRAALPELPDLADRCKRSSYRTKSTLDCEFRTNWNTMKACVRSLHGHTTHAAAEAELARAMALLAHSCTAITPWVIR
jgi:hypothetical protein